MINKKTKLKLNDKEVYQWYEHLEKCRISNIGLGKYARQNDLDATSLRNYSFRIYWFKFTNPEFFNQMLHYATVYNLTPKNQISLLDFIKKYDIQYMHISQAVTYLNYESVIKREMINRGIDPKVHFEESYLDIDLYFEDETNMEEFTKMTTKRIKLTDPEVYYWYEHFQAQQKSGLSFAEYVQKHKFDYATFRGLEFRIIWKKNREPGYYKKMIFMVKKFKLLRHQNLDEFCYENKLIKGHFDQARAHISYLQAIERELIKRGLDVSKLYPEDPTPEEMLIEGKTVTRATLSDKKVHVKKQPKPLIKAKKYYETKMQTPVYEEEEEVAEEIKEVPKKEILPPTNGHCVVNLESKIPANEIEFSLGMGVRVMVSPVVDSMKIIKIIDMLKAL